MVNSLLSSAKWKNYLYVEGSDDKNVFVHLLNCHKITTADPRQRGYFKDKNEHFEIKNCDGIYNLLEALRVILKGDTDNQRYGIVIDTDNDLTISWQKTIKILEKSGYSNLPTVPNNNGVIIRQDGLPVVGVWLMPDNKLPGAIEDFISFLGPREDSLWAIAQGALQQAVAVKCNFRPSYMMKAHLHTWLAWQEEPGTPMGQAITKKYVDAHAPYALRFVQWFRTVFDLDFP